MAPSGEHRPEDLGYSAVHAAAVATGNAAIALRQRVAQLHILGAGQTVATRCELLTAQAVAAEKAAATFATTAAALRIREDAAKAWNKFAPKDSELEAARKAVTEARKKLADAATASGDTSSAKTELEAALKKLKELNDRRKRADEVYAAAEKRADAKLAEIKGGYTLHDESRGHSADGTPAPGTGTSSPSTSPGTGRPSGETGSRTDPSKKTTTGSGTAKPSSTPAATPAAAKPTDTETSTTTPESTAALAALLASQQQQPQSTQQQQAQPTAQAAPVAATPQQAQPDKTKDAEQSKTNPWDKLLGPDGIIDTADLATLGVGTPLSLGGGSAPSSTPHATVTPSAPATPTPSATGLSAGTVTQPVTSGTSATGLSTQTDVTGRPAEQQRSAFSVGPETKTSSASGTGTNTAPAHATGTRPMGAGGMPMMPMGGMGGAGGSAGKDREQAQTTAASGSEQSDIIHGRHTVAEAVPGGTIAQRDHPRRRGEDAA